MLKTIINRKLTLLLLLIVVFLFLVISPTQNRQTTRAVEKPMIGLVYSVQNFFYSLSKGIEATWLNYIYLVNLQNENIKLKREIATLKGRLENLKLEVQPAKRLKELLELKSKSRFDMIAARVIGYNPTNWLETIIIDKGEKDGIREEMGVISTKGVIGKVIKTSENFSKVLLLLDRNIAIPAMINRTVEQGIVEGKDRSSLTMKYLPLQSKVKIGDKVVTSGLLNSFPRGLIIGEVTYIHRLEITQFVGLTVKPNEDASELSEVLVLVPDAREHEELTKLKSAG